MFRNKYLKQLRQTQARIRETQEAMDKLNSPSSVSNKGFAGVYKVLRPLLWDAPIKPSDFLFLSDASMEQVRRIGEYLINVSQYVETYEVYDKEIKNLKQQEKELKEKLGIE